MNDIAHYFTHVQQAMPELWAAINTGRREQAVALGLEMLDHVEQIVVVLNRQSVKDTA